MPSRSLVVWNEKRLPALDPVERAHAAIVGEGPGRRYLTQQINQAFAVLLSSQFQGFCRDLHSECVDFLVNGISPASAQQVVRLNLLKGRKLTMKKAAETRSMADRPHVKVGDLVTVEVAGGSFKGIVTEDRGPIGVGGRRLYGIVEIDVEPTAIELPEEQFSDLARFGSQKYLEELYTAIVDAAARSKADIIVSYYRDGSDVKVRGRTGDVQIRGRSMLPNISDRSWIVEQIDEKLAEEAESPSGRIAISRRNPPGQKSQQNWYALRSV
jgi:hypothetical protein